MDVARSAGVQFEINPSKDAVARFNRLLRRDSDSASLPGIRDLSSLISASELTPIQSGHADVLFAFLGLLHQAPNVAENLVDASLDLMVSKIRSKGGPNATLGQVVDIIYECTVYLHVASRVPGCIAPAETATGVPDLIVEFQYFGQDQPTRLAIECKNVTRNRPELLDLIRDVANAIMNARSQFETRKVAQRLNDYIVFVDLPLGWFLALKGDASDYKRLVMSCRRDLAQRGFTDYDDARVIFTTHTQTGMTETLVKHQSPPSGILPPVAVEPAWTLASRGLFLAHFFGTPGEPLSVNAWGSGAIYVQTPSDWYVER